jgi:hypothetical protein
VAVAVSVLVAGAGVADTPERHGDEKKRGETPVSLHVKASVDSADVDRRSMVRHPNPFVGKEETRELLRAKRPK